MSATRPEADGRSASQSQRVAYPDWVRACLIFSVFLTMPVRAGTFTVINTADAGPGSLRQAILDANATQVTGGTGCAPHDITFAIPGAGLHTIQPLSALPSFDIAITLNGYTQPGSMQNSLNQGSNAVIAIEVDGSLAGSADAITIASPIPPAPHCGGGGSIIRGLAINRFAGSAISAGEPACPAGQTCTVVGVRVSGNFIGINAAGDVAMGNGFGLNRAALRLGSDTAGFIVGDKSASTGGPTDPQPANRNIISGNASDAIYMVSVNPLARSLGHTIRNNFIGLSANGTTALGNGGRGITVAANASAILIEDNLISANLGDGIAVLDSPYLDTNLLGNGIGIGLGALPFGNAGNGIFVGGNTIGLLVGKGFWLSPFGVANIANNAGAGLFVDGMAQVDVVNASIAKNTGLAIDLAPVGPTPNDSGDIDSGPNELLNKPVIDSASYDPMTGNTTISGTLDAAASSNYEIYIYKADACDASGFGAAQSWVRLMPAPELISVSTDVAGHAQFSRQTFVVGPGTWLSAFSRRFATVPGPAALIVSEFSACRQIVSGVDLIFGSGFD
ncbi:MAG: hypothetical protein ABI451_00845 [Dokdonella sp.]